VSHTRRRLFPRLLLACALGGATMMFGFAGIAHASSSPTPNVLPCPCDGGGPYVTPFFGATSLTLGRTDQGVDYNGKGEIAAIGDGVVVGNGGNGWPGGHYLLYKLTAGTFAGKYIYVAEAINPTVSAGQHISEGQQIATFGANAAPGQYPGIEMGWGSSTLNLTLYSSVCGAYSDSYGQTAEGRAFARFLISLGTPVKEDPGTGPTYSTGCQTFGP
jgi:hypothetical protein